MDTSSDDVNVSDSDACLSAFADMASDDVSDSDKEICLSAFADMASDDVSDSDKEICLSAFVDMVSTNIGGKIDSKLKFNVSESDSLTDFVTVSDDVSDSTKFMFVVVGPNATYIIC